MDYPYLDLINSESRGYRDRTRQEDLLDDDEWLARFLRKWGLDEAGTPGVEARAALTALRTLLARMARAVAEGRGLAADDLRQFNALLSASPTVGRLVRSGGAYHVEDVPLKKDWNWVIAEIARGFGRCLGDPARVKFCANPDCQWAFYDESRNRSRRWCEYECGNVVKVRRFRARRKAEAT